MSKKTIQEFNPNYELSISKKKAQLQLNISLQDAIWAYTGPVKLHGKKAELIGELVSEAKQIESCIAGWEQQNIKAKSAR